MQTPRGFRQELYPLRHNIKYSFALGARADTINTVLATLVRHSSDIDNLPPTILVNPHNTGYVEETGSVCQKMSIIDRLNLSIRFNATAMWNDTAETASGVFSGDGIQHLRFLWRPIFFSFPEKLQATDDDTGATVETLLSLTSDDTNQDVVPITTNKLPTVGQSDLLHPVSTVNQAEVFTDLNMTTDTEMEDHVHNEDLLQDALRRFTNKGALRACMGRTRWVNLTRRQPFKNFYISQFVPRAIRRIVDRTYFGIQVHVPISADISQDYHTISLTASTGHIGCKIICNYHEWNSEHEQKMA